ncbi:MAG: hypothetical protein ACI4DO_07335 [Roseburia sp.]
MWLPCPAQRKRRAKERDKRGIGRENVAAMPRTEGQKEPKR